jgi:hypothetical protein
VADLPFGLWMALARATPLPAESGDDEPGLAPLDEPPADNG